jgi:hypothetical protein
MIFAKYSIPDQNTWNNLKTLIQSEDIYTNCAVVEVGNICLETDEEGNCVSLDPNYAVDIMWHKEIPASFNQYEVFPNPVGVHTFAGCEDLYKSRFCQFNPESPFCNLG